MMLRRLFAIAAKDVAILLRDRGSLAILFLLPVVLSAVFGSVSMAASGGGGVESTLKIPLALVDLDGDHFGRQVHSTLAGISALDLVAVSSEEEANDLVAHGDALAAVVLPEGFTDSVLAYEPSAVKVIGDPTKAQFVGLVSGVMNDVLMPVILEGELRHGIREVMAGSPLYEGLPDAAHRAIEAQSLAAIMTQLQRQQSVPWIAVRTEDLEGVDASVPFGPFDYAVPSITVMFTFFLVATVADSVWVEKEQGSMRRLLASPASKADIVGGKMLAYMLVICLQVLVLFTIGSGVYGMQLGHSLSGLVVLTVSLAFVATSLGMMVAALSRSSRQGDSMGTLLAFILAAVGGCIGYPIFQLGGVVGFISRLTPHAHAVMGYLDLITGAGLADILSRAAVLLSMGLVVFGVAVRRLRFV